ncbi:MAG TPA: hypothetical protein PLC80_15680, partial [Draconibacterium sp.]|nr:hypothetical protein [Draconibacterium sp.]
MFISIKKTIPSQNRGKLFFSTSSFSDNKKLLQFLLVSMMVFLTISLNATNYYVSSSGNDSNAGTSESTPWKTLAKVNSFTPKPGDQILFKRGEEWTGSITANASGTSSSRITYGAYGTGDNPKIYGSEVITGWTKHSGNIYKASFKTDITQLFVNGVKMKLARTTNTGYNIINSVTSQTQFTCNTLDAGFNYAGATVLLKTENYFSIMRTVTSSSSKTLSINSVPVGTIKVNQGFVLMNKLEFLDSPG